MKVLIYAGGEYVTGDEIAVALMEYSEALAEAGDAANIEIPIVGHDDRRESATFLVGPSSQIVAKDAEAHGEELVDDEVVMRLRALTRALHPVALPVDPADSPEDFDSEL